MRLLPRCTTIGCSEKSILLFSPYFTTLSVVWKVCSKKPSKYGLFALFEIWNISDASVPTEASEMFHSAKSNKNPLFTGFLIHTLTTTDKVVKYGENNKIDFSEHPAVVQRGEKRIINIYAAVPEVA